MEQFLDFISGNWSLNSQTDHGNTTVPVHLQKTDSLAIIIQGTGKRLKKRENRIKIMVL